MPTYEQAKVEVELLSHFLYLVDNYEITSLEDLVIHQYAIHNSISKVIKDIKSRDKDSDYYTHFNKITHDYVKQIILSNPKNELHTIIRKQYLIKTLPQRRRSYK